MHVLLGKTAQMTRAFVWQDQQLPKGQVQARFVSSAADMESFDQYDRRCAKTSCAAGFSLVLPDVSCASRMRCPCWFALPTHAPQRRQPLPAVHIMRTPWATHWMWAQAKFLWRNCGGRRRSTGLAAISQVFGRFGCHRRRGLVRCGHGAHARGCGQENSSRRQSTSAICTYVERHQLSAVDPRASGPRAPTRESTRANTVAPAREKDCGDRACARKAAGLFEL